MHVFLETKHGDSHACKLDYDPKVGDAFMAEIVLRGGFRNMPIFRKLRITKIRNYGTAITIIDHD